MDSHTQMIVIGAESAGLVGIVEMTDAGSCVFVRGQNLDERLFADAPTQRRVEARGGGDHGASVLAPDGRPLPALVATGATVGFSGGGLLGSHSRQGYCRGRHAFFGRAGGRAAARAYA